MYSSVYGWKIDQEKEIETIMQEMIAGVQINREPVYAMRANARGMNDIGSTYIEVDLSAQHLYYYQGWFYHFGIGYCVRRYAVCRTADTTGNFSIVLQEKSICAERKDVGKWEI